MESECEDWKRITVIVGRIYIKNIVSNSVTGADLTESATIHATADRI